ncbi:MAG: cytochrome c [Spirochaetia bacterium]|nr:cytochrome c [Spirochaetia bacterium]
MRKIISTAIFGVMVLTMPLFAEDTPTAPSEYQNLTNPIKGTKDEIERGETLYRRKCNKCHGKKGDGHGIASKNLETKPMDWSKPGYLKSRSDGQLFWFTKTGGKPDSEMGGYGKGTDANLSDEEIWMLLAYIRHEFTK